MILGCTRNVAVSGTSRVEAPRQNIDINIS